MEDQNKPWSELDLSEWDFALKNKIEGEKSTKMTDSLILYMHHLEVISYYRICGRVFSSFWP